MITEGHRRMSLFPSAFIVLLLTTVCLLTILTLRLGARSRNQRRKLDSLDVELKRSREQGEQQKKKLVERSGLDNVKDEFISTVSHELRTPLTSIRGALGLLSSGLLGNVDAKAQNLLRIASSNTERLIRLINDILDLERMESGRAALNLRRCSIYDLAGEAMDTMAGMADAAGVRLELSCSAPRDSIYFDSDPDRILQVLTNLLSNAIKFSPPASKVSIQIEANLDSLFLKVIDRGRGIPADQLESVFDRFQQVESSDSTRKGGTGLGLAICRSIIQQHGGAIWAQPNPPNQNGAGPEQGARGTTLWVQFSRSTRASDAPLPPLATRFARRGKGLIVVCDDDPGVRVVVAEQLRQHGYDVIEAGSGEEVITLAHEQAIRQAPTPPISAILLDLYMPGLSGSETLQQLKGATATAAIPVIILSAVAPTERPLCAANAQGWVRKPFSEELLLAELGRVLETRDATCQILLVEGDQKVAEAMMAGFEEAGVRIGHASTFQKAVDQCLAGPPGLLILDLTLPDGEDFTLVDWLRRQPALHALPMVVYSGRDISEGEMLKLRLGPTQFLSKAKVEFGEVEELVLAMVDRLRGSAAVPVA